MNRRIQWGGAIGVSLLMAMAFWWWTQDEPIDPALQRAHLALVLPVDLDGGQTVDAVLVYARHTEEGTSLVEAMSGEEQTVLWRVEVPGMGVGVTQGSRAGAVGSGVLALASRRTQDSTVYGQITVLDLRNGEVLWSDADVPSPCRGFWTQLRLQGDVLLAFCRSDAGHALRSYQVRTGEQLWEEIRPNEVLEMGPVLLPGVVYVPHPVYGRQFRLDGKASGSFQAVGRQVFDDGDQVVYAVRDEECASRHRFERMNRVGQVERLSALGDAGCLPEGLSPVRPLGWAEGLMVGVDEQGALIGLVEDQHWRLEFPEGFEHRGIYYDHKRQMPELSALHQLNGPFHPFVVRKTEADQELTRLVIVDLRSGELRWQSESIVEGQPWLSRHILQVEDRFWILVPEVERARLLLLDPETGLFTDAVELKADRGAMNSRVLAHHLFELHLYPERFFEGELFGSARDQVFAIRVEDWSVRSYRGDPITVEMAWKSIEQLLGELPRSR